MVDLTSAQLPMKVSYPGKVALGDMQNVITVMNWNKSLAEGNLNVGDLLADSVTWYMSDGMFGSMTRDSVLAVIRSWRNSMKTVEVNFVTILPVKYVDQNQDWVLSWTEEKDTTLKDSVETYNLHEDYLMVNGKIRTVYQYNRKTGPHGM